MYKFIAVAAASAGFLAALAASPEVRADSLAGYEGSSMADTLNNTDAGHQSGSESITRNTTSSERQNVSEASVQAEGPLDQRKILHTDKPGNTNGNTNKEQPKSWGTANAWGAHDAGPAKTWGNGTEQLPRGAEASTKAQLPAHPASSVPQLRMYDSSRYGSRIASRTVPHRNVIRNRSHSNAQYAYRAKTIKVTGAHM